MKRRVPSYYKEFKCIASACEDTCCAGWDVVIDAETYEIYQNLDGPFGDKLRSKIVIDEEGDHIFILDGKRCPFLNGENFCDIYLEQGEDYLCHTCQQFPRFIEEFGDLREMGISLSCPEAARIILGDTKPTVFELDEEEPVTEDSQVAKEMYAHEAEILEGLLLCRENMIKILEMEELSLGIRVAIILKFVEELQDKIDFAEFDEIETIRDKFSDDAYLKDLVMELDSVQGDEQRKYDDVYEYFKTFRDLEHIHENDPLELEKSIKTYWKNEEGQRLYFESHRAFNDDYQGKMGQFKKLVIYFVYRYFMKSFYDYELASKIKLAIISTLMIKELAVLRWREKGVLTDADLVELSYMYSKDMEHLEQNIDALECIFESDEVYQVANILNTLLAGGFSN